MYINNISKVAIEGKLLLLTDDVSLVSMGSIWDATYKQFS